MAAPRRQRWDRSLEAAGLVPAALAARTSLASGGSGQLESSLLPLPLPPVPRGLRPPVAPACAALTGLLAILGVFLLLARLLLG